MLSHHSCLGYVQWKIKQHKINRGLLRFYEMCSILIGYKNWWSYGHLKTLSQMDCGILGTCGNNYPTGAVTQNNKVESSWWLTSHYPDTVLVTRGLKFEAPLLLPTYFPSAPQENCHNIGSNSATWAQKFSSPFCTEWNPKFSTLT